LFKVNDFFVRAGDFLSEAGDFLAGLASRRSGVVEGVAYIVLMFVFRFFLYRIGRNRYYVWEDL